LKITNLIQADQATQHREEFTIDVLFGLSSYPKTISAKYFYDDIGSELFQKISQHSDYYLTQTEHSILQQHGASLAAKINQPEIDIIELGSGDGHKSKLIIDSFISVGTKVNFYPIDISEKAMRLLGANLTVSKLLHIHGIVADYFHGLTYLREISNNKKLVLFLGSNIGNFNKLQTREFLKKLWIALNSDDFVLIGYDLKKDADILNLAYNDSDGLTRDFNLNLLNRMNSELGADFDLTKFKHYGFYNPLVGAMESYIISLEHQVIYISALEKSFHFEKFEPVHLEYSFKFSESDINYLANHTGFQIEEYFSDQQNYFIDALWQVKKN
jgi:dimethylhistidine N-methyltransferase